MNYYEKWNKYNIGEVSWVNSRRGHLCRDYFIQYLITETPNSVIEIGGGEMIEGVRARSYFPKMRYHVVDVSNTFIDYAKSIGFSASIGEMTQTRMKKKEFDIVYACQVLEHSPNIFATFKELKRISNRFYFTMFKWNIKTGGLTSKILKKRNYYSTSFNIIKLISALKEHGDINDMFICTLDKRKMKYKDYLTGLGDDVNRHRNGNYLTIIGEWK